MEREQGVVALPQLLLSHLLNHFKRKTQAKDTV